jgi:hypothetical protein
LLAFEEATKNNCHTCADFSVLTPEGEYVCIRCGRVDEEETAKYMNDMSTESQGAMLQAVDHNTGNPLLNSAGMNNGYESMRNPGLAMRLNNPRTKDFDGRGIKSQMLNDPYKSGLVADPSRGCHVEVDYLTGKAELKFSRYDVPTLQVMKQKAFQRVQRYGLDIVESTMIAREVTRIYSSLVLNDIVNYAVLASLVRCKHLFNEQERKELEAELIGSIEKVRETILSGGYNNKSVYA